MSYSKILVAQLGARKHYQEPLLFHQWGVLDTLYTDFYAGDRLPMKLLRNSVVNSYLPGAVKRMVDRYEPGLQGAKVVQFPWLGYNYARTLKKLGDRDTASIFVKTGKAFCQRIIQHGFGNADTVYGFNSACLELFEYAKKRGLRCILDQTLAERFYYYQLMQAEETRWPRWSCHTFILTDADRELARREQQEQDLADLIICGSTFVKNSLVARGVPAEKITVVPLGRVKDSTSSMMSSSDPEETVSPWKTRSDGLHILFAGAVGLRKGIPYLLEALRNLKGHIPFVCKAAGTIEINSEKVNAYSDVCDFLGRVPRSEITSLYNWADVFVLPSICEGSAMVTYEALQYGVPTITTDNAGSILSNNDDFKDWIVPMQDPFALVKALKRFCKHPTETAFILRLRSYLEQSQVQAVNIFKQSILDRAS